MNNIHLIRLPLSGSANTRDIGGYACGDRKYTKWGKVLRSDCLSRLTQDDKDFLFDRYHVKKVIDLRSDSELTSAPGAFLGDGRIKTVHVSLSDELDPNKPADPGKMDENFLRDMYISILDNKKDSISRILAEISETVEDGAVIYHCTAGKDRTGVVTMLLLGICGVSKQDIAANYMQSSVNLKYSGIFTSNFIRLTEQYSDLIPGDIMKKIAGSDAENIEYAYDSVIENYRSFKNFYIHIGFAENEINKLVENLTSDIPR